MYEQRAATDTRCEARIENMFRTTLCPPYHMANYVKHDYCFLPYQLNFLTGTLLFTSMMDLVRLYTQVQAIPVDRMFLDLILTGGLRLLLNVPIFPARELIGKSEIYLVEITELPAAQQPSIPALTKFTLSRRKLSTFLSAVAENSRLLCGIQALDFNAGSPETSIIWVTFELQGGCLWYLHDHWGSTHRITPISENEPEDMPILMTIFEGAVCARLYAPTRVSEEKRIELMAKN
jgi:hypothetical protein